jgi:hypothetical protein
MCADFVAAEPETQGSAGSGLKRLEDVRSVPDLMVAYVNEINRKETRPEKRAKTLSHFKTIAWKCVERTLQAEDIRAEEIKGLLGEEWGQAREDLEGRLKLIAVVGVQHDRIRVALDPLAEYFGALWLVEKCGGSRELWRTYIDKIRSLQKANADVSEFVRVLLECVDAFGGSVPRAVKDEFKSLRSSATGEQAA